MLTKENAENIIKARSEIYYHLANTNTPQDVKEAWLQIDALLLDLIKEADPERYDHMRGGSGLC